MTPRRTRIAAAVLGIVTVSAAGIAMFDLDWKRDFTTNVAETTAGAADPRLRPLELARPLDDAAALIVAAAADLPRWEHLGRAEADGAVRLSFTRTTRIFRFVDDVTVSIEDRGTVRVVHARSASRVGRGDLGQNPRNIAELFAAVRRHEARQRVDGP